MSGAMARRRHMVVCSVAAAAGIAHTTDVAADAADAQQWRLAHTQKRRLQRRRRVGVRVRRASQLSAGSSSAMRWCAEVECSILAVRSTWVYTSRS
jgi:hypothetical protein